MESEDDIPASQPVTTHPPPSAKLAPDRRKKRKKLSLSSRKHKSVIVRSKRDEPSTSKDVNNTDSPSNRKINIYHGLDELEPGYSQSFIPKDYDIYESAKILEQGNVAASQEVTIARKASLAKFKNTQELISARNFIEMERNATQANATVPSNQYPLDTQMPDVTNSQFSNVCNLVDAAHLLIETNFQFSEWPGSAVSDVNAWQQMESVLASPQERPTIVQSILNDFEIETDVGDESDDSSPNTPPILTVNKRGGYRTYTRVPHNERRVLFDAIVSDVEAHVSDRICDEDIDLNASRMIMENIANLSEFYLQSQKIDLQMNDNVFERESNEDDEPLVLTNESTAADECGGMLEPPTSEQRNQTNFSELLSEDEAIFLDVETPKIPENKKRSLGSMIVDDGQSTPPTSKPVLNDSSALHPKRLRFEREQNQSFSIKSMPAMGVSVGFKTAGGIGLNISAAQMRKTATIFDEIMADFDIDVPSIQESMPSTSAGFRTARGNNVQLTVPNAPMPKINDVNINVNGAREKHVIWKDEMDASASTSSNAFGGFKTATGKKLNVAADTFNRYAALYKETEINRITDDDEFVPVSPYNKSVRAKFTTSTPNVSAGPAPSHQVDHFDVEISEFEDAFDEEFRVKTQRPQNPELTRTRLSDRFNQSDVEANVKIANEFNASMVSTMVKDRRKEALMRQQANCLRKNSIRPQSGALRAQKSRKNRMALKDLGTPKTYSHDELITYGVQANVIAVDVENVDAFKFEMWRYYSTDECVHNIDGIDLDDSITLIMDVNSCVGLDELSSAFLECETIDPRLVPDNWIRNGLKWILLKLAGLERRFPQRFAGNALTPANVMMQLKYRYDREIDRAERSAIRKIVEQDDVASKPLVLFVSRIKRPTSVECSLELCDGWYAIGTCNVDMVLANAVHNGKIRVGTKLLVQDAELVGAEEACSPLEMPSSTALKIAANSTRRVKWHTKLGYFNGGRSISFSLNSIEAHGGHIGKLKAYIARIYPMLYLAKTQETGNSEHPNTSRTVIRSERAERRQNRNEDREKFETFEALYAQASAEVEREYDAKKKASAALPTRDISEIDDGEELWHLMEQSKDAESFENDLTLTQKSIVESYQERFNREKLDEIGRRVKEKLDEKGELRRSTPLLKIRIVDCDYPMVPMVNRAAVLSIWNADESYFDLRENSFVEIMHASANGLRAKDLLITANKRTKLRNITTQSITDAHIQIQRKCYPLVNIKIDGTFKPHFNEFDAVAYVLFVEPFGDSKFQTIYLVDSLRSILLVKFWNGLKHYAFDNIIESGQFLAICNLEWRPSDTKSATGQPQAFANDLTTFTETPKSQEMIESLKQLSECFKKMADETAYIDECMTLINERPNSGNTLNSSAHSTSILSVSNHRTSEASPMNHSLNNSAKRLAKMKIERLKLYKSPPPAPAIVASDSSISALRRPFKSPFATIPVRTDSHNQENETR